MPRRIFDKACMLLSCCASAFSACERSTGAFIVRKSWMSAFNACEHCMGALMHASAAQVHVIVLKGHGDHAAAPHSCHP